MRKGGYLTILKKKLIFTYLDSSILLAMHSLFPSDVAIARY